jgi:DNA-binding NarL/FixJ family response regulator
MPQESRIFIVDDQPVFYLGLSRAIQRETDLTVCGHAANATEALEKIEKLKPDLVIVDIALEDSSGLDLLKQIAMQDSNPPCLVLSTHPESRYAQRAVQAGALGYLTKQESVSELLTAIRALLKGGVHLKASVATRFFGLGGHGNPKVTGNAIDSLTQREFEVFGLIGQEYSVSQIAKALHVSVKTIETHRAHIKEKLNLVSANELLIFAVEWTKGEEP